MTPELIGILTVGVAIVAVLLVLARMVMDLSNRIDQRFDRLEALMDRAGNPDRCGGDPD